MRPESVISRFRIGFAALVLSAAGSCSTFKDFSKESLVKEQNLEQRLTKKQISSLAEISNMVKFAEKEFGMDFNGAYSEADLSESSKMFYFVIASLPDKIEYVLGRGYEFFEHDKEAAIDWAKKLAKEGYHVSFEAVESIGAGKVPITKSMIEADPFRQAFLVFHEGLHHHFRAAGIEYIPNSEEPTANYIGYILTYMYFKKYKPQFVNLTITEIESNRKRSVHVNAKYHELNACYSKKAKDCQQILEEMRKEYPSYSDECVSITKTRVICGLNNTFFSNGNTLITVTG